MRKIRNCVTGHVSTGISKCPIDWDKVKGAIVCARGHKLPAEITPEALETACHADGDERIFPIMPFVEYAKTGGDPQAAANGYGPMGVNSVDSRTDAFTLKQFYEGVFASLSKNMNTPFDVYYFDDKNILHGYNDGTDVLAGVQMSTIYPTAVPFGTSSEKASMIVNFCYEDARDAQENFDYVQLDFNPKNSLIGLVEVELVKTGDGGETYKVIEKIGGYDRTEEFGEALASGAASCIIGAASATYENGVITVVPDESHAAVKLAKPSVLYAAQVKGIEQL